MENTDFDFTPTLKIVDLMVFNRKVGRGFLYASIPELAAVLYTLTQISFTNKNWLESTNGIIFLVAGIVFIDFIIIGSVFYLVGRDINMCPIRISLVGSVLTMYLEKDIRYVYNLTEVNYIKKYPVVINHKYVLMLDIKSNEDKRKKQYIVQHIDMECINKIFYAWRFYRPINTRGNRY